MSKNDIARFERFISPEPNTGCWLWDGGGKPYGNFWADGRSISAHRFSYLICEGVEAPSTLHVDHKCRVKCCVNPEHLELVTPKINQGRKLEQKNQYMGATHCIYGHEFTAENTYRRPKTGQRFCRICVRTRIRNWRRSRRNV